MTSSGSLIRGFACRHDPVKVGVVGLGKMGLLHSSILNVLPNAELTAACDKSRTLCRFFRKLLKGVRIVDNVEKFSDLDLDAIYVTAPIRFHFLVAKTVYLKTIARNLFVEKTLAWNHEEARKMSDLADQFGGVNMVGYLRRFAVTFKKARDLLAHEAIGKLTTFRAYAYSSDFLSSKGNPAALSSRGGVLRDLGCHAIDLALWFFEDLQTDSVSITSATRTGDSTRFTVENAHGLQGEFEVSCSRENYRMAEVGFSIQGSEGMIEVNDDKLELKSSDKESITWYRHDLKDNVPYWLGLPEYYREDSYFIESVAKRRRADPSFDCASKTDRIIELVTHGANARG